MIYERFKKTRDTGSGRLYGSILCCGTCWCGCYPQMERAEALKPLLDITSVPVAIVAVGESAEDPSARGYFEEAKVKYL